MNCEKRSRASTGKREAAEHLNHGGVILAGKAGGPSPEHLTVYLRHIFIAYPTSLHRALYLLFHLFVHLLIKKLKKKQKF